MESIIGSSGLLHKDLQVKSWVILRNTRLFIILALMDAKPWYHICHLAPIHAPWSLRCSCVLFLRAKLGIFISGALTFVYNQKLASLGTNYLVWIGSSGAQRTPSSDWLHMFKFKLVSVTTNRRKAIGLSSGRIGWTALKHNPIVYKQIICKCQF